MEKSTFTNEFGNHIIVKVKHKNDIVTDRKTGENIKFKAISVSIIGPRSTAENIITYDEALQLHKTLSKFLEKNKREK